MTRQQTSQKPRPGIGTEAATLSVAYTPDSDDAYCYWALEHERLTVPQLRFRFSRNHIIALNHAAMAERHDVTAVSSAVYPLLAARYRVLSAGTSVGRGYGPVLAARQACRLGDLAGKRVAVAGVQTTGGFLAVKFCPGAEFVQMPYDRIADAVAAGQVDAGVMIHEELLAFDRKGLVKVADLGQAWCESTGLPLPVGLNLVHRRVADPSAIADAIRRSLLYARSHHDEAMVFAAGFGRGCAKSHVEMFANEDTLRLPDDVREAMGLLFAETQRLGLTAGLDDFEIVE
ncbi:MAG: 1,4-dihydroxy-6-naphtoate synthase [Phycisphaerae bacterium]|nr:1,4-dihydroxy-6-naphtoate synthase [Phycisphaerae bacterium]